jgi:hypothetical protein
VEHNQKNQRVLRHTGGAFSQAVIEGEVALPVGKPEMARLLLVRGRAETGSVESLDHRAMTDGTLTLCVCYLDNDEQLHAFESVSTFKHTAEVPGAQAGMRGVASADVSEIETTMTDSRRINIMAVIDVFFRIMDEVDFAYLSPMPDDGLVYRTKNLIFDRRCARAATAAEVSGETVLQKDQPNVMQVLDCQGQAVVQQAFGENDLLCVEGELKLCIAYATDAPQTPIAQCTAQLPFSQMLPASGAQKDMHVSAAVKVKDLVARGSDDGEAIVIRAVLAIELEARMPMDIEVVEDAYALASGVQVAPKTVQMSRCIATNYGAEAARETVTMQNPEEVDRILAVFATPSAARATGGEAVVTIETVITCQVVYVDKQGRLQSQSVQWPQRIDEHSPLCTQHCQPIVRILPEQAQAVMIPDGLDVRVLMNMEIELLQTLDAVIAGSIVVLADGEAGLSGIMVYFADEGEMIWDIAKRYRIAPQDVTRFNENVSEPLTQGQRLILLCRHAG